MSLAQERVKERLKNRSRKLRSTEAESGARGVKRGGVAVGHAQEYVAVASFAAGMISSVSRAFFQALSRCSGLTHWLPNLLCQPERAEARFRKRASADGDKSRSHFQRRTRSSFR